MTAVADGLTVCVKTIGDERPEPMLIIGCRPHAYPLGKEVLLRAKQEVAGWLQVSVEHFVDLDHRFDDSAERIPLIGLLVEEFSHLGDVAHCDLIRSVRRALGLPCEMAKKAVTLASADARAEPVETQATAAPVHSHKPATVRRPMPAYH